MINEYSWQCFIRQGQAPADKLLKGGCTILPKLPINKMWIWFKGSNVGRPDFGAGDSGIILAGGMESMSNAPHLHINSKKKPN